MANTAILREIKRLAEEEGVNRQEQKKALEKFKVEAELKRHAKQIEMQSASKPSKRKKTYGSKNYTNAKGYPRKAQSYGNT
tara:strand:- start:1037 stop:1279 length:243 start_codon:yes stop_codon:yes gene_type:complete